MKNILKFALQPTIFIIIVSLVIYSCRKSQSDNSNGGKFKYPTNVIPLSIPTFSTMDEVNSHLRYLAYGLASLTDTLFLSASNDDNYVQGVEGLILGGKDEVSIGDVEANINKAHFAHYTTQATPQDFGLDLTDAINHNSPGTGSLSPRTWALGSYNDQGMGSFNYNTFTLYTLIRIPNWDVLQNNSYRLTRKLLVIPYEKDTFGDYILPIVGYYVTSSYAMDSVLYQTEDEMEDDTSFYQWIVDIDEVPPASHIPDLDCSGDKVPVASDGYCDCDCGENVTNSPIDCDPANLRKVWIEELEVIEDYKKKCVGTNTQWMESHAGGQYELAYHSFVAHSSGKIKFRGGRFNDDLKRKDIYLTKKIPFSCNFSGKGTSINLSGTSLNTWEWWGEFHNSSDTIMNSPSLRPKAFFSKNFKPWRDTIYFIIYEFDGLFNDRFNSEIEVFYRAGRSGKLQQLTRKHEGAFGDKNKTTKLMTWGTSYGFRNMSVVRITPNMWPNTPNPARASDQLVLTGAGSSSGANADQWSLILKIKYDL